MHTDMRRISIFLIFIFGSFFLNPSELMAQKPDRISWLTFDQLDDSLALNPKKVFVNFTADWCTYCHEMEKTTFADSVVIQRLNRASSKSSVKVISKLG